MGCCFSCCCGGASKDAAQHDQHECAAASPHRMPMSYGNFDDSSVPAPCALAGGVGFAEKPKMGFTAGDEAEDVNVMIDSNHAISKS